MKLNTQGHRWFTKKYGVQPAPGTDIEPVIKAVEAWREKNGLPHPQSPLVRGVVREALAAAKGGAV